MGNNRNWTQEEKDYLAENWGRVSVPSLSKHLNRTANAVMQMSTKLHLGAFLEAGDYVSFHQLLIAIGYNGKHSYHNKSWVKNRAFPVKYKQRNSVRIAVVYLEDFWEWAEKNQDFLDFSRFPENALGIEPDWVKRKRKQDFKTLKGYKKIPWTPYEDERLRSLLRQHKYSFAELSKMIGRTEGAIQRRITDLKLKERPVKADTHNLWTSEQVSLLGDLIKQGYSYEAIHEKIPDKSVKAIRGYVFRFYLTENLDKVRNYIGSGKFGDNMPPRKLYQRNCMSIEERAEVKAGVSQLAYLLYQRARQISPVAEEYKNYWQKDMCMNWSDIHGCTAGEADCDSCASFIRIQPQFCKRCGITFFERTTNDICQKCRTTRFKQAQRKYAVLHRNK